MFGKEFKSLSPGSETVFFCEDSTYSSTKFDITFRRKKKWGHIIVQPFDNAGEAIIKNGKYVIVFVIKRNNGKFDVSYDMVEID